MSMLQGAPAPDLIEPILGFRQWRLCGDSLLSAHCAEPWPSATLTARCLHGRHPGVPAPVPECCCGIYAWYRRTPRMASAGTADMVCGAIVMWGRVELHPIGMRGQYAQIVALALPLGRGSKRRALQRVAERLYVPVVPYSDVDDVAAAHGAPVPDFMKPRTERATW
jgi:hypothetical protein